MVTNEQLDLVFENNTTPALNEDNLNAMVDCINNNVKNIDNLQDEINALIITGGGGTLVQDEEGQPIISTTVLDTKESIEDNTDDNQLVGANGLKEVLDGISTGVELTQAEYDALPDSKYTDGIDYYIKDAGGQGSSGTNVIANPTLIGSESNLTSIQIGSTKYKVEGILKRRKSTRMTRVAIDLKYSSQSSERARIGTYLLTIGAEKNQNANANKVGTYLITVYGGLASSGGMSIVNLTPSIGSEYEVTNVGTTLKVRYVGQEIVVGASFDLLELSSFVEEELPNWYSIS